MRPVFPRINTAINYSLEYYGIGQIAKHLFHFDGTEINYPNRKDLDSWLEIILEMHDRVEDEILQTIHTCNNATQVYLFENLKLWATDIRLSFVNESLILEEIEKYNSKTYADFLIKIEDDVQKFRNSPNFYREHKEEYEVTRSNWFPIVNSFNLNHFTTKEINYKYYCIEEKPKLLDVSYLKDYYPYIAKIVEKFTRIINTYISQYEDGKLVPKSEIASSKQYLIENDEQKTLPEPPTEQKKLKVNISVPELAYLFKMLNEAKPEIFSVDSKAELYRFISANFSTKATENISVNSIANNYTTPDKKTAIRIGKMLAEMLKRARNE